MLLRRLLPGVFDRQSEGEQTRFRERSKPRARKLNGHAEHLIRVTDPLPGVPLLDPGPSALPGPPQLLCPGDGKIPADIKGLRAPD